MNIIFYIAATVALISTILAVSGRNAIHALLFLIMSLLSISVIFYILGAPFIAALEVIVYAGAIMVLFIFVIMMLNVGLEKEVEKKWLHPSMWVLPALLALILFADFIAMLYKINIPQGNGRIILPKEVGISLFSTYLIGVEIAAILLLAGIVGAYHLGRQKKKVMHRFLQKQELIQPEEETV
ncbi:MAG TPA: NADH-quinone oxidoreductase subunit J [Prolixibacteraceae bacterium]|nr:NADH-quinone oxidoreductase subunit J [Prolixibacteraceae bacterium]